MLNRFDIINSFITKYNLTSYLEIGVRRRSDNFDKIHCSNQCCVDPDKNARADFVMTSDNFFAQNTKQFDIVFIDGLHEAHQVYKDIQNSLKFLKNGGVIILHDCNPCTIDRTIDYEDNPTGMWNGDCWKAFVKYRFESDYECYTINADEGCGIIDTNLKANIEKQYYSIGEFTYSDLEKNRQYFLDLR